MNNIIKRERKELREAKRRDKFDGVMERNQRVKAIYELPTE